MLTPRRSLLGGLILLAGLLASGCGADSDHAGHTLVAAAVASPSAAKAGSSANGARTASVASNCPKNPPPFIRDSFPQPKFRSSANGILSTTLTADMSPVNINGKTYVSSVYEKSYPGPTLMVCPGDTLKVAVRNNLTAADFPSYQASPDAHTSEMAGVTNLHTHGFFVSPHPPQDDVFIEIQPGGGTGTVGGSTYDYRYDIPTDHRPGAYWYHPHVHTQTNVQESGGMEGAIIMRGGLDNRPDYRDIGQRVLIITQTALNDNATPAPATVQPEAGGKLTPTGAQFFVNGYLNPTIPIKPGEIQRWSVFNLTSNSFVDLKLQGQSFQLLARDGNYVTRRETEPHMLISPSSRREVLVKGPPQGTTAALTAEPFAQFVGSPASSPVPLATLKSAGSKDPDTMPPEDVASYQDLRKLKVKSRHRIVYSEDENNLLINGQVFDPARVDQVLTLGELSEWTIVNKDNQWHTFHIHINDFQVVAENGKPVKGIKQEDNVSVPPMLNGKPGTIKMLYLPKRFTGKFVFHCHILGHEDLGMMGTVLVEP